MARYTKDEEERAREYIRQRLSCESSMSEALQFLVVQYAQRLAEMLHDGASQADIDMVLEDLIDEIIETCELLAVDEHDDRRDSILLYINRAMGDGKTMRDRVRERCRTLLNELIVLVAAGIVTKTGITTLIGSIGRYITKPFSNPIIEEARRLVMEGKASTDVDLSTPGFGHGVPVSSETALENITVNAIGEGWLFNDWQDARDRNAIGFIPMRGSDYPCDECDSHAGKFHNMGDEAPLYHLHCKCYIVWVYGD